MLAAETQPLKVAALIVLSDDLLRKRNARTFLMGELVKAVGTATDQTFLSLATDGVTPVASTGATDSAILADLRALLDRVTSGPTRPHFIVPQTVANAMASKPTLFPNMTPRGGSALGVPVHVTQDLADSAGNYIVAVDASAIAFANDTVTLAASNQAALQMTDSPSDGATNLVALFQTNSTAMRAVRYMQVQLIRSGAVAITSGVEW